MLAVYSGVVDEVKVLKLYLISTYTWIDRPAAGCLLWDHSPETENRL
jgi:hypothetical protein